MEADSAFIALRLNDAEYHIIGVCHRCGQVIITINEINSPRYVVCPTKIRVHGLHYVAGSFDGESASKFDFDARTVVAWPRSAFSDFKML